MSRKCAPVVCKQCKTIFMAACSEIRRGSGIFCGRRCQSTFIGNNKRIKSPLITFRENVTIPENKNDCWIYKIIDKSGYGRVRTRRTYFRAHRFSYEIHKGSIPEGIMVCHSCDNPACVNPAHLWLGTGLDNTRDKINKGRANNLIGSSHQNSKLNEQQVKNIKLRLKEGKTQKEIAAEYNVAQSIISRINCGKTWRHVQ